MDLQSTFYLLAIIVMLIMIAGFVTLILIAFRMKQKADAFKKNAVGKTLSFVGKNNEVATLVGVVVSAVITSLLRRKSKSS